MVDEFLANYIFDAVGEIGEVVDAFEEPATGHRASGCDRVGVRRVRHEDSTEPEAGYVRGGGGVLACKEERVDRSGGEVVGLSGVFS